MVRLLGGPLRLNERAADNIFNGWISTSRPLVLKTYNFFYVKDHSVAIKTSETTWHLLAFFCWCCIFRQICFPTCEHSVRRDWQAHLVRNFSFMWRQRLSWAWRSAILVLIGLLEGTCYATVW